jgi:hypothetical protein
LAVEEKEHYSGIIAQHEKLGHEILQDVLGTNPSTVGEETMIQNTSFREAAE